MNPDQTAPLWEQSDLGPYCLQYRLPKYISRGDEIQPTFIMDANTMNPDQTAPWSSLIWVHIVCNIGYQSTYADERAGNNCRECRVNG